MSQELACTVLSGLSLTTSSARVVVGAMVQVKIIIGILQTITELPSTTLNLQYPPVFDKLLQAMMRILMLDVFDFLKVDCIRPQYVRVKFCVMMLLPVLGLLAFQALRLVSNCRATANTAQTSVTARYRSFFVTFLLFPQVARYFTRLAAKTSDLANFVPGRLQRQLLWSCRKYNS